MNRVESVKSLKAFQIRSDMYDNVNVLYIDGVGLTEGTNHVYLYIFQRIEHDE